DGHRDVGTYMNSQSPEEDLQLNDEEECCEDKDEAIVIVLEFPVIVPERIDARKDHEHGRKTVHEDGNEDEPPEFRQGAVLVSCSVPVGCHNLGHHRVEDKCHHRSEDEDKDNCR